MEGVLRFLIVWIIFIVIMIIFNLTRSNKQHIDDSNRKIFGYNMGGVILIGMLVISIVVGYTPMTMTEDLVKYDWCYPSCDDNVQSSFKFSSDGTFTSSTIMFGGMSRWGKWEKIDDNTFRLTTTRISTNSSNDQLPEPQIVTLTSDKKLRVGSTVYVRN